MRSRSTRFTALLLGLLFVSAALPAFAQPNVKETVDGIVTRLYATMEPAELQALTQDKILDFITPEEKQVLATKECYFDVNVPVIVSVMRNTDQKPVPFWLEDAGFQNTGDTVTSEWYTHEIWQKKFGAGRVELGINGFDNERKAYFVCVGPQNPGDTVEITHLYPDAPVINVGDKTWTYRDWDDLYLDEYPAYLEDQQLLTTFRGRSRAAFLVGAFRQTEFPSSPRPDQITLTWSDDPRTTQTVQWRTDTSVEKGAVQYREADATAWQTAPAGVKVIEDRMLMNDRYIHHFTAVLRELEPATTYAYRVGDPSTEAWSDASTFTTAPDGTVPFTFLYTGDTHNSEAWGALLDTAFKRHPDIAFYVQGGDVVSTGLNRVHWDQVLNYGKDVFNRKPFAFVLGNHDDQDGLGAGMILDLFRFPENGPANVERGRIYTFRYSNVQFFMVDVGTRIETVTPWLEQELAKSGATWKIFIYHFPLYNNGEEDYGYIAREWGPLFDKYGVNLAFHGHIHRYFRTKPIRGGEIVESLADGTTYIHTVGVDSRDRDTAPSPIAAVSIGRGQLYQKLDIDGNRLHYRTYDIEGNVLDEFVIEK